MTSCSLTTLPFSAHTLSPFLSSIAGPSERWITPFLNHTMSPSSLNGPSSCMARLLPLDDGPHRPDINMPVGHRPMISLQHDRIPGCFGNLHVGAGTALHFHVILHREPVIQYADESRVFDLLPARIKARRAKPDLVGLPLARPPAPGQVVVNSKAVSLNFRDLLV